jgi:trimeric autotransporter adhesin
MTSSPSSSEDLLPLLVELEQLQVLLNSQKPPPDEQTTHPSSASTTPTAPLSLVQNESRIISLASSLSYRLREYENIITSWSELDSNLSGKISSLLKEYFSVMKHKKSYFSSCFKSLCCCCCSSQNSSKSSLSKDETFAVMESKFIEAIYLLHIQLLQQSLQELTNEYQYAHRFSSTLSDVSSSTAFFSYSDHLTIEEKYLCREKLRKLFYSLNEYKAEFIHETPAVKLKKRLGMTTSFGGYMSSTNGGGYIPRPRDTTSSTGDTPKRFRDIQEILQISHDQTSKTRNTPNRVTGSSNGAGTSGTTSDATSGNVINLKKAYRQVNHSLHDLCQFGSKLLLFKCEMKSNELTSLLSLAQLAQQTQQTSFLTLETSYPSLVISKFSPHFLIIKESLELIHHNLSTSLVELSHRWSLLRTTVASPTFLSSYFGSGDEDLDEMFPISISSTSSSSTRPSMKTSSSTSSSSSSQRLSFTSVMDSLSSSNSSHIPPTNSAANSASASATSTATPDTEESFSLQMKKIFLDSFSPTTPPPPHPSASSVSVSAFTSSAVASDSNHSSYSNHSSSAASLEEGDSADEKLSQLKNKFKSSISSVAQKASKAAASAAAIASNGTQKAVSLASEAKNKVTSHRPRRGSGGGGGLMTGGRSYTALVDMN